MAAKLAEDDKVLQICFVTPDLEQTAEWFSGLTGKQIPPINQTPEGGAPATYQGERIKTGFRQMLFDFGNIAVEFIQPGTEPGTWRDFLDEKGPSVHHIAFKTRNIQRDTAFLADNGHSTIQLGEFEGGGGRYGYYDTIRELGCLVELLEFDSDRESQS